MSEALEKVAFTCRICKGPGVAMYDPAGVNKLSAWIASCTHNKCYDRFYAVKRASERVVEAASLAMTHKQGDKLESVRQLLIKLTKAYATAVSTFYNKTNIWDIVIVERIVERPEHATSALRQFARDIRDQKQ